jgi:hypothetical protein
MTSPEEVAQLNKKIDDIALRGASKEDLEKLTKLLQKDDSSPPSSPVVDPSTDDTVKKELDELAKYRENERQTYLKKLPKKVIEEFKLEKAPLDEVKKVHTLTQALKKRDVGITTPAVDPDKKEKKFQWNPETGQNEWC